MPRPRPARVRFTGPVPVGSRLRATLRLQGTYDRPLLFGQADIERGNLIVEGNRYVVNRGTISFSNPTRIEPYFDFEAETRIRLPGQTYVVTA